MVQLIKNLLPESDIDISAAQNIPYFLIKSGDIMDDYVGLGDTRQWDTTMGSIAYTPIADIYQTLYVNGDEENNITPVFRILTTSQTLISCKYGTICLRGQQRYTNLRYQRIIELTRKHRKP